MSAIYGLAEIAQALGVDVRKVRDWREAGHLPEPTAKLSAGYVWAGEDIEEWIRERQAKNQIGADEWAEARERDERGQG